MTKRNDDALVEKVAAAIHEPEPECCGNFEVECDFTEHGEPINPRPGNCCGNPNGRPKTQEEMARAAIAAVRAHDEARAWLPIESAPQIGKISLLVQDTEGMQRIVRKCIFEQAGGFQAYLEDGCRRPYHLADNGEFATHWSGVIAVPLPTPPQEGEG